jgi:hypothetical protein
MILSMNPSCFAEPVSCHVLTDLISPIGPLGITTTKSLTRMPKKNSGADKKGDKKGGDKGKAAKNEDVEESKVRLQVDLRCVADYGLILLFPFIELSRHPRSIATIFVDVQSLRVGPNRARMV